MRILLVSNHIYPIAKSNGAGKKPSFAPSGSSGQQFDLLASGLAQKGHNVFYLVDHLPETISPKGIELIFSKMEDVDIVHLKGTSHLDMVTYYQAKGIPVFATNHSYTAGLRSNCEWMYVSKALANLYGKNQYIWNGLDQNDYIYAKEKYVKFYEEMISKSSAKQ